jgi:membrane-bound ClpP family serine protease
MQRTDLMGYFRVAGLGLIVVGLTLFVAVDFWGGAVFAAIGAIWLIAGVFVSNYYRRVAERQADDRRLFETGERAVAVIEGVEATATAVNHMPVVRLTLRVRRANGDEFVHTEKVATVPTAMPVPGHLVDVAFDPGDLSNVALDVDPRFSAPPGVVLRTREGDN